MIDASDSEGVGHQVLQRLELPGLSAPTCSIDADDDNDCRAGSARARGVDVV
jgi:hypothetical protein